jgi:hypothetical protein
MSDPGINEHPSVWELLRLAVRGGDEADVAFQTLSITWLPELNHYWTGATTSRTAKCHHIPNTLGVGLLEKRPPERDAT